MVPQQQRALALKPTPPYPFFLLAACFQQVPEEELLVTPQHPFWGDVSPSTRCRRQRVFASVVARAAGDDHQLVHGPPRPSKAAPEGRPMGWFKLGLDVAELPTHIPSAQT
jgi:hypothetical protein